MVLVLSSVKNVRPARRAASRPSRRAIARLRWLIRLLSEWRRNAASRRNLATLNEYYLKDIGLSRHDILPDSSPPCRLW